MPGTYLLNDAALHFLRLAGDIISQWEIQKRLSAHWFDGDVLQSRRFGWFFPYVNGMLIDGWFLSVGRLHDPAETNGNLNVSICFLMRHPQLNSETKTKLDQNVPQMNDFAQRVKKARHKLIAHNDLKTVLSMESLGGFPSGEDDRYIDHLRIVASVISQDVLGKPFLYNDLAVNDIDALVSVLRAGLFHIDHR